MPIQPVVETSHLTQRYGAQTALDDVNLRVAQGALFALLGPNGGGKTTLFRILATLLKPTGGSATVCGADVVHRSHEVRRHLGIVFQNPSLDRKLTVLENLVHQGRLYGMSGRRLRDGARSLLDRFGLVQRQDDRVETLSGGLARRVELAKSLLHGPPVVLLDEPSSGLDHAARADLMSLLRQLCGQGGVTCIMTTHLMDEAENCSEVAILDRGRLVAVGTPADLTGGVGHDVITIAARDSTQVAQLARSRLDLPATASNGTVRIELPRAHEMVPRLIEICPGQIDSVTVGRPTLGDAFLRLTGHAIDNVESEPAS